jgi:gas vesicle protein
MTTGKDVAKIAALVAGGAIIGLGVGLLYAPRSGAETRRQLRHYAKKTQIQVARFSRDMKQGMDRMITSGKSLVGNGSRRHAVEVG